MKTPAVDRVTSDWLLDQCLLSPYRSAALRNPSGSTVGLVVPPDPIDDPIDPVDRPDHKDAESPHGGVSELETQCLVRGSASALVHVRVRFLQLAAPDVPSGDWDEATAHNVHLDVSLGDACQRPVHESFRWPLACHGGTRTHESLRGDVGLSVESVEGPLELFRVTLRIANTTPVAGRVLTPDERLPRSLVSTHALLRVKRGAFLSLIDPPPGAAAAAAACSARGLWPVLVGDPDSTDTVLAAPLRLMDYPYEAPYESRSSLTSLRQARCEAMAASPDVDMGERLALRLLTGGEVGHRQGQAHAVDLDPLRTGMLNS